MTDAAKMTGAGFCPHCFQPISYILPIEPVYDMQFAAPLIPQTQHALRQYLYKHKDEFPRRYRKDRQRRLHRQLTASEIRLIRSRILKFKTIDGKQYRQADSMGN